MPVVFCCPWLASLSITTLPDNLLPSFVPPTTSTSMFPALYETALKLTRSFEVTEAISSPLSFRVVVAIQSPIVAIWMFSILFFADRSALPVVSVVPLFWTILPPIDSTVSVASFVLFAMFPFIFTLPACVFVFLTLILPSFWPIKPTPMGLLAFSENV